MGRAEWILVCSRAWVQICKLEESLAVEEAATSALLLSSLLFKILDEFSSLPCLLLLDLLALENSFLAVELKTCFADCAMGSLVISTLLGACIFLWLRFRTVHPPSWVPLRNGTCQVPWLGLAVWNALVHQKERLCCPTRSVGTDHRWFHGKCTRHWASALPEYYQ